MDASRRRRAGSRRATRNERVVPYSPGGAPRGAGAHSRRITARRRRTGAGTRARARRRVSRSAGRPPAAPPGRSGARARPGPHLPLAVRVRRSRARAGAEGQRRRPRAPGPCAPPDRRRIISVRAPVVPCARASARAGVRGGVSVLKKTIPARPPSSVPYTSRCIAMSMHRSNLSLTRSSFGLDEVSSILPVPPIGARAAGERTVYGALPGRGGRARRATRTRGRSRWWTTTTPCVCLSLL